MSAETLTSTSPSQDGPATPARRVRTLLREFLQIRPDLLVEPTRDVLGELPGDLRRGGRQITTHLTTSAVAGPPRLLVTLLRRFKPVLKVRTVTVLTDTTDVLRALTSPAYTVAPYRPVMRSLVGDFALGLDGVEHAHARARLLERLDGIDSDDLVGWADQSARLLMKQSRADGELEVVSELAVPIVAAFGHRYLGVQRGERAEQTEVSALAYLNQPGDLADLTAQVFEACFFNLAEPPDRVVGERGKEAARTLAARCPHATGSTTEPGDQPVEVRDLVGLVVGAVPTMVEAIVRIVRMLVTKQAALDAARDALEDGADRQRLWRVAAECLRMDPVSPAIVRGHREHGLTLATVYAPMQDPRRVPSPRTFRTDRPEETYLIFGFGPHRCVGERFAREVLTSVVAAAASEPGLARLPGQRGRIRMDGPFPGRLVVSLSG